MDSKIKIDLELKKEQAARQLAQFEADAARQLEKLQKVQARYNANPTAFVGNQLKASAGAYNRRLEAVQQAQSGLDNLQLKIDKEDARKGGRLFGMQVNKQTEAFAKQFLGAYVGRELMRLGFMAAERVGGDNHRLEAAQETSEGALTGAAVGSIFGPMGTAVGAVTGGLIGLASASIKLQKEIQREQLNRSNDNFRFRRDTGRAMQSTGFNLLMEQTTDAGKVRLLRQRMSQLANGKGANSLKSIDAALQKHEAGGDIKSNDYMLLKEKRGQVLAELASMRQELMSSMLKTSLSFQDPSKFADSMQKQGLYAGGAVNVGDVNKGVVDELKLIRKVAEKIAGKAYNNLDGDAGERYMWQELGSRYTGK